MGLLEKEILELRNMRRDYRMGKLSEKNVGIEIAIYSAIEKRARLLLAAHINGVKIQKGLMGQIFKTNLIGDKQAIDVGEDNPEDDKVQCDNGRGLITVGECLDYSGSHHEECSGCPIENAVKEKLLGQEQL